VHGHMLGAAHVERLSGLAHKATVGSLLFLSVWGLAFIGAGCGDIYVRAKENKRLKAEAAAKAAAAES
jgi:hypothetical protein